jgi:hypothetical protein
MTKRTALASVAFLATLSGTIAFAWPDQPGGQSERSRGPSLKLGEELPPPRPDEDQATKVLVVATTADVAKQKGAPFQRDQHPKQHGCVRATLSVADEGLPESMRVGIFRQPRTYQAIIRFSNGKAQDDNVPDAHGMAIKLLGVEGPKLLESESDAGTQDFIMIDHEVFFAIDPKNLVEFLGAGQAIEKAKAGGDLATVQALAKQFEKQIAISKQMRTLKTPSPLEMTYFSEVPYKLGTNAVKYSAVPNPENKSGRPDLTESSSKGALREAMIDHLTTEKRPATFTLQFQMQTDPVKMPVEDPTVAWDSKPITAATITIPPQEFARPDQLNFCENLSFTPWHSLEAHRPIGGISRARKSVYEATSKLRHANNNQLRKEPTIDDLDRLFKAN